MTTPWIFGTGGKITSAPLVHESNIFVGSWDGCLYAVEPGALKEKWRFATGDRIYASPATDGDTLFLASSDSFLYALDPVTGAEKWRFAADSGFRLSPNVGSGLVVAADQRGTLYAVDAETGEERWRYSSESRITHQPAITDEKVWFSTRSRKIYSLTIDGGRVEAFFLGRTKALTSPVLTGELMLVGSESGLHAFDISKGEEKWIFKTHSSVKTEPLVSEGSAFIGAGTYMYGIDIETGTARWEQLTGTPPKTEPLMYEGTLFYAVWNREFFALDSATGNKLWSFETGRFPVSPPAISNEMLLIGSGDGNLYGYDLVRETVSDQAQPGQEDLNQPSAGSIDSSHILEFAPLVQPYSNAQEPWRLFVLAYLVGFYYQIYWFYRNWKHWQVVRGANIRPGLRTLGLFVPLLNLYLIYDQFRMVKIAAVAENVKSYSLFLVTTGYMTLTMLPITTAPLWERFGPQGSLALNATQVAVSIVASMGAVFVLLAVQRTANRLWLTRYPENPPRTRFENGEIVLIFLFSFIEVFGITMAILAA